MAMTTQQVQDAINSGKLYLRNIVGNPNGGQSYIYMARDGTDAAYKVNGPETYIPAGPWKDGDSTTGASGGYSLSGPITSSEYIPSFSTTYGDPNWSPNGNLMSFLGASGLMLGGLGALGYGLGGEAAALNGVGSINPSLASSFAETYAPSAWSTGAGAAGTAGGSAMDWTNFFDGWMPDTESLGSTLGNTGVGYGQSMATAEELAAMQSQYPDWYNQLTGITQGSGTSLMDVASKLKSALGGGSDWMKTLGSLGSSALGAYASLQQTNALEQQAQRYEGYGAPYRQKLSDLYADPTSFLTSKEVTVPVDQGTQSLMRSLSTQGNPFGSGNALQQGQSYASDQLFGKLGQEKDRLAGFGGLSNYNQAAPQASTNAINSSSNAWNALGSGANNIFNPPQTPAQQAAEWMKAMGK